MRKKDRVIYYSDPINDDFAGTAIKQKTIDASYPYKRSRLWRAASFVAYYAIAMPIVAFICRFVLGIRVKNKKAIRKLKGGFCLYGNHTYQLDAFLPPIVAWPKRAYTIANADVAAVKGIAWLAEMLGAVPIPTGLSGMTSFLSAIRGYCDKGHCIGIFPEAHIWPYYTGIRPLQRVSFRYPVTWDCPMVVMTLTYQHRTGLNKWRKKPKRTLFISEPMYRNSALSQKEAQEDLRLRAQAFMDEMAKYSTYEYIRYEYRENQKS
ncbi:MAG: 1-acyl-sn-glycerol-3-phosphate acyltransferase [Clostridia bacterium]|nr:1-acyl-sn-glycerol-3-phosphate acyltransferase [Clostridia bacterium]